MLLHLKIEITFTLPPCVYCTVKSRQISAFPEKPKETAHRAISSNAWAQPPKLCVNSEKLLAESFESLLELINTSACIDKLLLAGEEGVALRANLDFDLFSLSGLSNNGLAACALDNALYVFGLDSFLHFSVPHKIISL